MIISAVALVVILSCALWFDYRARRRWLFLAGARYGGQQIYLSIVRGIGSYCDTPEGEVHEAVEKIFGILEAIPHSPSRSGDYFLGLSPQIIDESIALEMAALGSGIHDTQPFKDAQRYFAKFRDVGEALGRACYDRASERRRQSDS